MLTRAAFANRFAARSIFGMVHLHALPGAPLFTSMSDVLELALHDARALAAGGCDGFVIENFGTARSRADGWKRRRSPR